MRKLFGNLVKKVDRFLRPKRALHNDRLAGMPVGDVVSCADNPMDLRPVVNGFMEKVGRVSASLTDPNQPIIVVMFNEHRTGSHIALKQIFTDGLVESGYRVACGVESPHNELGSILKEVYDYNDLTSEQIAQMGVRDTDGQRFLNTSLASSVPTHAPILENGWLNYCRKKGIRVSPCDAASVRRGRGGFIDLNDSLNISTIKEHFKDLVGQKIDCESPNGAKVRDKVIVHNVLNDIKNIQAQGGHRKGRLVYELHVGMGHYDNLMAEFEKAGKTVMPVFLTLPGYGLDKIKRYDDLKNGIVVEGMSSAYLDRDSAEELDFARELSRESDFCFEIFKRKEVSAPHTMDDMDYLETQVVVQKHAPQWIAELDIAA